MEQNLRNRYIGLKIWARQHPRVAYPVLIAVLAAVAFVLYRFIVHRLLHFHIDYAFDFSVFLRERTGNSTYLDLVLWGLWTTIRISAISIVLAMILGTVLAVLKLSRIKIFIWISSAYIEFFRNTPLLIQIFIWYFGSDPFLPQSLKEWIYAQKSAEFVYGAIALTTYTAAFIAEEIRAGIQSIPREQMEAARSQGFTFLESMRYVILPQAFRIVIPPLINQSLNLVKNSSLVMAIGVVELTLTARMIEAETSRVFEGFSVVTLIYLGLSLIISFTINQYNRRYLRYIKY
jgi:polar amino acid transport system permease protein